MGKSPSPAVSDGNCGSLLQDRNLWKQPLAKPGKLSSAVEFLHTEIKVPIVMKISVKAISIGLLVLSAGTLLGLGVAYGVQERLDPKLTPEIADDPVERYDLGRNAFKPPRVKRKSVVTVSEADRNQEVGKTKEGKRLLVPAEPAKKSERDALEAQDKAQREYFGDPDISQSEAVLDYQASMNPGASEY